MAREPFTEETARSFSGYSLANALLVSSALTERGCRCEPYADVFTFARWRAQGRTVKRGEHGIRLPVIIAGERTDKATGTVETFRMMRASFVFCRCQTEALEVCPFPTEGPERCDDPRPSHWRKVHGLAS